MGSLLTIKELKEFIRDLPEVDEDAEDYEVWIGNGDGLSNCATTIHKLNYGDIIIDF
jgi:hypothetical protein